MLKHLFLEDILDNVFIKEALLNNWLKSLDDFHKLATLNYSDKFQTMVDKYQSQISQKQKESEKKAEEMKAAQEKHEQQEHKDELTFEQTQIKDAVQFCVDQYLIQFDKAKIFQIKKLGKLTNKIVSLAFGYVQRQKHKDPDSYKYLTKIQTLITVNVLLTLIQRELVKIDLNQQMKSSTTDYQIDHNVPENLTSIKVELAHLLWPEQVIKLADTQYECIQWCKLASDDPAIYLVKYLVQMKKPKKGTVVQSEQDKLVAKVITHMEKSVFKPKGQ